MQKSPESPDIESYLIAGTDPDVVEWYAGLAERAQEAPSQLVEDEVVVLDTETTGLDPARCSLIQIAAARMRGPEVVGTYATFVDPGVRIPPEITELTGIRNADLEGAPSPREAVAGLAEFAGDLDLVAHNAGFDRGFIMQKAAPGSFRGSWIDTFALAQIVLPRFRSHKLEDLSRAFGVHPSSHRATDDVEALCGVWRVLLAGIAGMPAGLAGFIAGLSPATDWPLRKLFQAAADATPGIGFSLKEARTKRVGTSVDVSKFDAEEVPLFFPTDDEIRAAFTREGAAGAMYEGYEQRDEQVAMALEVNAALRDGAFAVLEAGTGVGKSMAYLLPCALAAKRNAVTIGVATKTNTLMDQLVYHELPRLSKALGGLSYVALKGYGHYICLRKLERLARGSGAMGEDVLRMVAMLCHFAAQTSWGDLDTVNVHWFGLPRQAVQANAEDCLKRRCPFYPGRCYLHGARRQAGAADIVVTNHALLFRDIQMDNGILPPIRHWVVDEAHAVESEARKQLSRSIAARDLEAVLNRLTGSKYGIIANARKKAAEVEGGNLLYGVTADIDGRIDQIRAVESSFFSYVKELGELEDGGRGGRNARGGGSGTASGATGYGSYDRVTLWVGPELRASGAWETLLGPGRSLVDKLDGLVKRLRDLISTMEQFEGVFAARQADLSNAAGSLQEMLFALSLVLEGEDESYVYSVGLSRDPDKVAESLNAAKLDIGEALAQEFYPNEMAVVYTSATLATGDAKDPFAHFLRTSGLSRVSPERVRTRQLESSYDFEHNMTVLLPDDVPEPSARGYREALGDLLLQIHRASGGSVLTLFTNRREMEALYRKLKPQLADIGIDLLAQTRGASTKALRDRFLEDETLSLFALKSFWEGFDAPGETLRCVVIPKLPFGRPTDPIARERELRESRSAWGRYSLPEAIMDLKQAAGRLIRNSTDSGWLVLADARLQTKSYGKRFLRAMPTSDIRTMSTEEIARTIRDERPGR